jgi:hypothetical protein
MLLIAKKRMQYGSNSRFGSMDSATLHVIAVQIVVGQYTLFAPEIPVSHFSAVINFESKVLINWLPIMGLLGSQGICGQSKIFNVVFPQHN